MNSPLPPLLALIVTMLLGACANIPGATGYRALSGQRYLDQGIAFYEEGNYRAAARRLMFGLEEGLNVPDRVKAHKYLAFISCVSGHQMTCREEFTIALNLDPAFELDQAEAGHPIWGPVFRSAKAAKKP